MTFSSDFLAQLRAARDQGEGSTPTRAARTEDQATPQVPIPLDPPTRVQVSPAPDLTTRAGERGRCGTCRHWSPAPDWGGLMGECALGWKAHLPWVAAGGTVPPLPVMHGAARCMCAGLNSRWAGRKPSSLPGSAGGEQ